MADGFSVIKPRTTTKRSKYSRESLERALTEGNLHDGTIKLPSSFDINKAVADLHGVNEAPPPPFSDVDKFMTLNNISFDYEAMAAAEEKNNLPNAQTKKPLPSTPQNPKPVSSANNNNNTKKIEDLLPSSFSDLPQVSMPVNMLQQTVNLGNSGVQNQQFNHSGNNINGNNPNKNVAARYQHNVQSQPKQRSNTTFGNDEHLQNIDKTQNIDTQRRNSYQPAYLIGISSTPATTPKPVTPAAQNYATTVHQPPNQNHNQFPSKVAFSQPSVNLYAQNANPTVVTSSARNRNPLGNATSYQAAKNEIYGSQSNTHNAAQQMHYSSALPAVNSVPKPQPAVNNVPNDWQPNHTPDGRLYYIDHSQKKTHWPPPPGWAIRKTNDSRLYYVHHPTQTTHWKMPPLGWDICKTPDGRVFYADHINKKTSWTLPSF